MVARACLSCRPRDIGKNKTFFVSLAHRASGRSVFVRDLLAISQSKSALCGAGANSFASEWPTTTGLGMCGKHNPTRVPSSPPTYFSSQSCVLTLSESISNVSRSSPSCSSSICPPGQVVKKTLARGVGSGRVSDFTCCTATRPARCAQEMRRRI